MSMQSDWLGAVLRRFGEEHNNIKMRVNPLYDNLPDETYHLVYDDEDDSLRLAHMTRSSVATYHAKHSVKVPHRLAKFVSFKQKPDVSIVGEPGGQNE